MHRVELKVGQVVLVFGFFRHRFLMHRVELKVLNPRAPGKVFRPFLMYRVELKVSISPTLYLNFLMRS